MEDSVQIRCHRCKSTFREKARRLQSGYSRQCISCETMLFFDDASADKNIQRTLREAVKKGAAIVRVRRGDSGRGCILPHV